VLPRRKGGIGPVSFRKGSFGLRRFPGPPGVGPGVPPSCGWPAGGHHTGGVDTLGHPRSRGGKVFLD